MVGSSTSSASGPSPEPRMIPTRGNVRRRLRRLEAASRTRYASDDDWVITKELCASAACHGQGSLRRHERSGRLQLDLGVYLGGRDVGVAEQLAQLRQRQTVVQTVSREGVAERVR